ncbi:MAG TPA: hypothetical protein VMV10_01045 [Pirellulales bacterium]|nr:hypothetical protein [Pirellulales bacterium]
MIDAITNIEHAGGGYFNIRFDDTSKSEGLHSVARVDGRKLLSFDGLLKLIQSEFPSWGEDGAREPAQFALKESWEKWLPAIQEIMQRVNFETPSA